MNRRHILLTVCVFTAAWMAGCGGNSRSSYIPKTPNARQALQTALDTWKAGTPHGPITSSKPAITVFEARWRDGKKLESFEIVEEVKDPDHPQFKVKLQLTGEPEAMTVYHVVGIDPLNIYGDEDFKQQAHTM